MAVRKGFLRGEQILGRDQALVAQQAAEGFDFLLGPSGEIGQGALAGFVPFAPGFAEEDGGRGVAVGDDIDVHGYRKPQIIHDVKTIILYTWVHIHYQTPTHLQVFQELILESGLCYCWNFGLNPAALRLPLRLDLPVKEVEVEEDSGPELD
jgi:hypothetical protein